MEGTNPAWGAVDAEWTGQKRHGTWTHGGTSFVRSAHGCGGREARRGENYSGKQHMEGTERRQQGGRPAIGRQVRKRERGRLM